MPKQAIFGGILVLLLAPVLSACGDADAESTSAPEYQFNRANTCGVDYFQGASEVWAVQNGMLQKLPDGQVELAPGCSRNVVNGKLRLCGWYPC